MEHTVLTMLACFIAALLAGAIIIYGLIRFRYRDTYKPLKNKLTKIDKRKDDSSKP